MSWVMGQVAGGEPLISGRRDNFFLRYSLKKVFAALLGRRGEKECSYFCKAQD